MGLTKIFPLLILCIFFLHIEASESFRQSGQKNEHRQSVIKRQKQTFYYGNNHIGELKNKILRDRKHQEANLPPYLRKRNRRFKSIHEMMHKNDYEEPQTYGHMEYQQFLHKNEIPETNFLQEILQSSVKKPHKHHHKRNYHSKSHQKLKHYRSKPEVGIMQKRLKFVN